MNRRHLLIQMAAVAAFATTPALAAEEKKKGGGKGYTQFPMLTVTTGTGQHGTLSVDLGLYTDDDKLQAKIKMYQPRLVDAYVTRMQSYASILNSHSLADPDYVSKQLQMATDTVLGQSGAKVLLGSIILN